MFLLRRLASFLYRKAFNHCPQATVTPLDRSKMEVTKHNFAEQLPLIEKAIEDAAFIAIDGEFTGLHGADEASRQSPMDTPAERYSKSRKNVKQFLMVQFGLCTFHYDEKTGQFTNRAFNFYVWPRPYSRAAPDSRFMCQTSSIDFLVSQNFDFNKVFRDGISYLKSCDEAKIREIIQDRQQHRKSTTMTPGGPNGAQSGNGFIVPEDQKDFVEKTLKMVEKWLKDSNNRNPLYLESCNPFQRRILYSTIKPKFSDEYSFHIETVTPKDKSDRNRQLMLIKVSN